VECKKRTERGGGEPVRIISHEATAMSLYFRAPYMSRRGGLELVGRFD